MQLNMSNIHVITIANCLSIYVFAGKDEDKMVIREIVH